MSRPVSARRAAASQAARASPAATASKRLEEQVDVGDAEHGEDVVGGDARARVGHELLERPERVAEGAGRVAGEQGDGVGRDVDLLGGRRRG